jgi:hypothetical protein
MNQPDRVTELERVLDYWRGLAKSWGDAKDRLEVENARLRRELADTKERLEHERAENRYLVTGEEDQ